MDLGSNWKYNKLFNELTKGRERARQLWVLLNSASSSQVRELSLKTLSSYDTSLRILELGVSTGQSQPAQPTTFVSGSPISADGSAQSGYVDGGFKDHQEHRDVSKKRKVRSTGTDDCCSWKKYGQKNIVGATFPRTYFQCTNCSAKKQVQRSNEDPPRYKTTYTGKRTCNQPAKSVPPPPLPEKQNLTHNNHQQQQQQQQPAESVPPPPLPEKQNLTHNNHQQQQQQQQSNKTFDFLPNQGVNTAEPDNQDTASPHISPASFGGMPNETQFWPLATLDNGNRQHLGCDDFLNLL